ncbi:MAG: hypothetical protein KAI21_05125, partial [Deltaproteobacteria bacterium]|nr:hypothetical protein [Deltaproteobacteria bacterium]
SVSWLSVLKVATLALMCQREMLDSEDTRSCILVFWSLDVADPPVFLAGQILDLVTRECS